MSFKSLIKKFSSNSKVGNYNTIICNGIIDFINSIYNVKLSNLNLLEDEFRNYSWYIDLLSGKIYHLLVSLNNMEIQSSYKDNYNLLNKINVNNYSEILLDVSKMRRNDYLRKECLFKFSINSFYGREHFSLNNFWNKTVNVQKINRQERLIRRNNIKKRKRSTSLDEQFKWLDMVSASKVRNYLLNDPLLDWLNEFNITSIYDNPKGRTCNSIASVKYKNNDSFTTFIMNQGILFELEVYKILKKKFNVVKVAESYQSRSSDKYDETINYMKEGVDILYQPVLQDFENKIYGSPDLLVRSDKINKIFGYEVIPISETTKRSRKLNRDYHYIVIDIKHSTLYLNSDGKTLRNTNSIPVYKGQILVYNIALGNIQGYESPYGFILGKKWEYTKSNIKCYGSNFLSKLGEIDYNGRDYIYRSKTNEALEWIRNVRNNGQDWSLLPYPSRRELYPNMKNERDGSWRKIKINLDKKIKEITSVWMCGIKKRNIAHRKGIYSWDDKKCNSKNLEFKEGKTYDILNKILEINRQDKELINIGSLLSDNTWREDDRYFEFYIDYETMNSNLGSCVINENNIGYNDNNFIFLVGIGWSENNEWKYKEFVATSNTPEAELNMMKLFWEFINKKTKNAGKIPKFYHWTKAEESCYKKFKIRHSVDLPDKNFYDMYYMFLNNRIVVKDSLKFSLKSIANSLNKNKLIETVWDSNNPCSNGLKAMLLAYKLYDKYKYIDVNEPIMKDIIHYNEIDCKVLWEIMNYLRNNY